MVEVARFLLALEILAAVLTQDAPVLYDAYFGKPVTEKRGDYLTGVVNGTSMCTVLVRPCRKDEGRRVDGTCTNPHYPSRGARLTPFPRLLPPQFGAGNSLPPASDGSELPSARLIRTTLLANGFFTNHHFSLLMTHFHEGSVGDNVELFYLLRYGMFSTCCIGNRPNRVNPMCIPIPVPDDDPYLRETDIRCLNLTRVETYQDYGCLPNTLPAERYNRAPPLLELSFIYGNTEERSRQIRTMQGGLLAFQMEGDREVPAGQSIFCTGNQPPEVRCYNFGDAYDTNLLPGGLLLSMWFFREHNRLARRLSAMNPCWDDEKVFQTARQINIAEFQYIYYYELIPLIMGLNNVLTDGIIYNTHGYVNDFDHRYEPGVYREFMVGIRFFHNYKPAAADLYRDGVYAGSRSQPEMTLRSGAFAINNTEADLTQGSYIQPAAKFDYVMDGELAQRYTGRFLRAADLPATDIMRGRDAGFPFYNQYRKLCGMKVAKDWGDYYDTIDEDKVESLRRLYDDVNDVELMVAIYMEKFLPDAYVGPTLYCIMAHTLLLWRKSDKFFFEHGDHPTALTIPQLNEIRMTSISRILCDNGAGVSYIQPHGFLRISEENKPVSCDEIVQMNLYKWMDPWCPKEEGSKFPQSQPMPGQPIPGPPMPGQPIQVQPNPGPPIPGLPLPGQPIPDQLIPGSPIPGLPMPGQPIQGQPNPGPPIPGLPMPGQPGQVSPILGSPIQGQPYPGPPIPGLPVQGQPIPDTPFPGSPMPGQPIPDQLIPGLPIPGLPMPGQLMPDQPIQGQPNPGPPIPGLPMPGQPIPDQLIPGSPKPGLPMPGQPMPGQPIQGQPNPGPQIPGLPMPGQPGQVSPISGPPIQGHPNPGPPIPGLPVQGQPIPDTPFPGSPMPGQPIPDQLIPGLPIPGLPMPGQPMPDQPIQGQPNPGPPIPGLPMPGQPIPDQLIPGSPKPGLPMPGQPMPGQPIQGQPNPGPQIPGLPMPGQPGQVSPISGPPIQGHPNPGPPIPGLPVQGQPIPDTPIPDPPMQGPSNQEPPIQGPPTQVQPIQSQPNPSQIVAPA